MSDPASEFDGPWKEALDLYFRSFIELLFPHIAVEVNWDRPYEFLDTELQKIVPEAEAGRGSVDKLVRVWTRSGESEDVLVHIEVQSQRDSEFERRMYRYNHRLEDRYGRMPVSLAVLGNSESGWRPVRHYAEKWGCEVEFRYPAVKLMDFVGRETELEENPNFFAAFVHAHLATKMTQGEPHARLNRKLLIVKGLYNRGMTGIEIRRLFRLLDWVMALPPQLAREFSNDMETFEKEEQMPFITTTEQVWLDEGRVKGLLGGIEVVLKLRFQQFGLALMPRIRDIKDPVVLESFLNAIETAPDIDALVKLLPPQA